MLTPIAESGVALPPVLPSGAPPAMVAHLAGGREVVPVWANEVGQVTWRLGPSENCDYVKHGRQHDDFNPPVEAGKLAWVSQFVPAPRVISHGTDGDELWMLTHGLPGRTAVSKDFDVGGEALVAELGRALRVFHDRVPVTDCPFSWTIEQRLDELTDPNLAEQLRQAAPPLDIVVSHGDSCNPNFLMDDAGRCTGYVDLGRLGVADRWADLQPALLSLSWNFPDVDPQVFLDGYGIAMDPAKYDWYLRLWTAEA